VVLPPSPLVHLTGRPAPAALDRGDPRGCGRQPAGFFLCREACVGQAEGLLLVGGARTPALAFWPDPWDLPESVFFIDQGQRSRGLEDDQIPGCLLSRSVKDVPTAIVCYKKTIRSQVVWVSAL